MKKGQKVTLMSLEEIINSDNAEVRVSYCEWGGTIFGISKETWDKIRAAASNIFIGYADIPTVAKIKSDYYGLWFIPVALLKEKTED